MLEQWRLNQADDAATITLIQNQTCTLQACLPKRRPFPGEAGAVNVEATGDRAHYLTARASHIIEAQGTLRFLAGI